MKNKEFNLICEVHGVTYYMVAVDPNEAPTLSETEEILEINDDVYKDVFFSISNPDAIENCN